MYTKKQYTYVHQQTIYKCTPTIKDKCTTTNKKKYTQTNNRQTYITLIRKKCPCVVGSQRWIPANSKMSKVKKHEVPN